MLRKVLFAGAVFLMLGAVAAHAEDKKDNFPLFKAKVSPDIHQNFLDFDRNRDGYISFAEFAYAYRHYYVTGDDPSPLSQHFAAMDTDGNGLISEKEFVAGHATPITGNNWMRWVPNGDHEDAHN